MRTLKPFLFFLLACCLSACGTTQYLPSTAETIPQPLVVMTPDELPPLADSLARVFIIRPNHYAWGFRYRLFLNNELLGKLGPDSYLYADLDPKKGPYSLVSKAEYNSQRTLVPKAGKTYYYWQRLPPAFFTVGSNLVRVDDEKGRKLLGRAKTIPTRIVVPSR